MYGRQGVLKTVLDGGGTVYTIGPSDAFLRHHRHPVVFTRRELADRAATLTASEIRSVDLTTTIHGLHGSGLDLCVIHDYDAVDSKFKSVMLHARSGITDSVCFLERCMGRDASAAGTYVDDPLLSKPARLPLAVSAAQSVSNVVTITFRFWHSLVLYAIFLLLDDDTVM
jgi:hypothetical protein